MARHFGVRNRKAHVDSGDFPHRFTPPPLERDQSAWAVEMFFKALAIVGAVAVVAGVITAFVFLLFWYVGIAGAHIHGRSDLDPWLGGLASKDRGPCCDLTEAETLTDVEWTTDTRDCRESDERSGESASMKKSRFCVRLKNPTTGEMAWWAVPEAAVVYSPNRFGPALVWHVWVSTGKPYIRCFMPGAGT